MGSLLPGSSEALLLNCKPRGCEHSCRNSTTPPSVQASVNGFRGGRPGSTVEDGGGGAEKSFQLKCEI